MYRYTCSQCGILIKSGDYTRFMIQVADHKDYHLEQRYKSETAQAVQYYKETREL